MTRLAALLSGIATTARAGIEGTMLAPVPDPMPSELAPAAALVRWIGPIVPPEGSQLAVLVKFVDVPPVHTRHDPPKSQFALFRLSTDATGLIAKQRVERFRRWLHGKLHRA